MATLVGTEFTVLADDDGNVARAYDVFDLLGDGVAAPATFIIDKNGTIAWKHVGENISDRPSNGDIMRELAEQGY